MSRFLIGKLSVVNLKSLRSTPNKLNFHYCKCKLISLKENSINIVIGKIAYSCLHFKEGNPKKFFLKFKEIVKDMNVKMM